MRKKDDNKRIKSAWNYTVAPVIMIVVVVVVRVIIIIIPHFNFEKGVGF